MIDMVFQAMDPIMNDLMGSETATCRRSLRLVGSDGSPALSLLVVAVAGLGSTSVRLKSVLTGNLGGYIGEGLTFVTHGHAYTVTKDSSRADDGTLLVTFTPGLLVAAAINDSVIVAEDVEWNLYSSLIYAPRESVIPSRFIDAASFALSVPMATTVREPRVDDIISCSHGTGIVLGSLTSDGGSWEPLVGRGGTPAVDAQGRNPVARDWP